MENPYHHQILEEQLASLGRVRVRQLVERHGFLRVDVAVGEFLRFFRHWAACLIISRFTIRQARPEGRMVRAPRGRAGFYSPDRPAPQATLRLVSSPLARDAVIHSPRVERHRATVPNSASPRKGLGNSKQ